MAFKFEKLIVWQKALELSNEVHNIVKEFPKDELYVLSSQIRRAANSVSLNIVEGSTGQSNPEFKRFLRIALRSAVEVVGCIYLADKRKYITRDDFNMIYLLCQEIVQMIAGLIKSLK